MPRPAVRQDRIYDALHATILRGDLPEGARLPSIRQLAAEHGVSNLTVQGALERLARQGYVVRRHGKGVFVADHHRPLRIADSVVLCVQSRGHLWGDFCNSLVYRLGQEGLLPLVIDTHGTERERLLRQSALADASYFLVSGGMHFPFETLLRPAFETKTVVGIVNWETDIEVPGMYRILCDRAGSGRAVAEHLSRAGHRHAVFLGTPHGLKRLAGEAPGLGNVADEAFLDAWRDLGGTCSLCEFGAYGSEAYRLDRETFFGAIRGTPPATAVVGQFDVAAWLAQRALREEAPERERRVEIIGFGNTPWSHAATRPISTVDLQLPEVIERAVDLILRLQRGETPPPREQLVPYRLLLRATSESGGMEEADAS